MQTLSDQTIFNLKRIPSYEKCKKIIIRVQGRTTGGVTRLILFISAYHCSVVL